ncbi:MAG: hypothetical protein ACI4KR_06790 [Ruminiclostridium sp.]
MKEIYEAPKMEIVEFETEDVITTSCNPDVGDGGMTGDPDDI